eukprot:637553-Amorphochlora_amoeboformis.AAC.1
MSTLPGTCRYYRILPDTTGYNRALPGTTGYYRVLLGCRFSPILAVTTGGTNGYYRVPSTNGTTRDHQVLTAIRLI